MQVVLLEHWKHDELQERQRMLPGVVTGEEAGEGLR